MTLKTAITSILLATACITATNAQATIRRDLEIPAQELGSALVVLARQARIQVVYSAELVQGHSTRGLSGSMTPLEALDNLPEQTGLEYEFLDEQTVTLSAPSSKGMGNSTQRKGATAKDRSLRIARAQSSAATSGTSAELLSQRNTLELEEVVVTAQKREERLQDVPVPVAAISGETLTARNQLRIEDYYNKIPGLGLALVGNGSEPAINIRGVTTSTPNPTVGIIVDEVSYGFTVSPALPPIPPDVDPGDLARVEVLRGPQGTLYGAASIGGLLKFVTIDPSTAAVSGRVQAGLSSVSDGSDAGFNIRGSVNLPLADTVAVRASGFRTRDAGFVDNPLADENDVNRRDNEGGRLSALWRPSDVFSVKLSALIQKSERDGSADVDTALDGLRQNALVGTGVYNRDSHVYSATIKATLGSVELTSATGYSIDKAFDNVDASGTVFGTVFAPLYYGVTGASIPFNTDVKKFTQEVRASLPLGEHVTWLLGAFYTDEELDATNTLSAVDPASGVPAGIIISTGTPNDFREQAVFTNFTFQVADRFDVQVGGRFSENEQSFQQSRRGLLARDFFDADPFFGERVNSDDNSFTYLVTPRLRISDDLMAYARFASGYRPGSINPGCGIPGVPCDYGPDTTKNFEIGLKGSTLDRRLSYEASIYYIDWQDIQIGFTNGAVGWVGNASEAKSQGVELSAEWHPLPGFTLSGWIAGNEAELTEDFPQENIAVGLRGDRLPFSSRFSANVSAEQEFPVSTSITGFLGGSVSYVGDRVGGFGVATQQRAEYPSYTQVDLHAGLHYDTWRLSAFANNLTNKRGVLRAGLDSISPNLVTYIQPRTVGLSLAKTF